MHSWFSDWNQSYFPSISVNSLYFSRKAKQSGKLEGSLDDPAVEVDGANLEDLLDGVCCLSIEALSPRIEVSDVLSISAPEIGLRITV
jgi:predicted peroxiredoxin